MKKLLILPLVVLLSLSGCKKPEDIMSSVSPPTSAQTDSLPPLDPLKQRGMIFLPTEEYNNLPLYEINTKGGGRLNANSPIELEMPPIDDQGEEGSCNAWAAGYAVRSYLYHTEKGTSYYYPASAARNGKVVFSPRFLYNTILRNNTPLGSEIKDDGCLFVDCFKVMASTGICTLEDMPYVQKHFTDEISAAQKEAATRYKLAGWKRFPIDETKIIEALQRKIPVAIGIWTDDHFDHPKKYPDDMIGSDYIWRSYGKSDEIGHGVVIFGYDDTRKAFKVMNSWGRGWANKGWIWMDHSLFSTTTTVKGKTEKVIKEAYVGVNSLEDLKLVSGASGQVDVSYNCDGRKKYITDLETYTYSFLIRTKEAFDGNVFKKYIFLITPDKKAYYALDLVPYGNDNKSFSASITYAPKSVRTYFNPITGNFDETPLYKVYDISNFQTGFWDSSKIWDNYFTPTGTYELMIVTMDKNGQLTKSKQTPFPKPFFDITSCDNRSDPTPLTSLYSVSY